MALWLYGLRFFVSTFAIVQNHHWSATYEQFHKAAYRLDMPCMTTPCVHLHIGEMTLLTTNHTGRHLIQ